MDLMSWFKNLFTDTKTLILPPSKPPLFVPPEPSPIPVYINFYKSIIVSSSLFRSTERVNTLSLLEPVTRAAVQNIISDAKAMGIELVAFETYRSQELQEIYYKNGATTLQQVGVHHFGLACDLVVQVNGALTWTYDYSFLGPLAKKYGMIWGGDWGEPNQKHSFLDLDHVQRIEVSDQEKLFAGNWYPDSNYRPYNESEKAMV